MSVLALVTLVEAPRADPEMKEFVKRSVRHFQNNFGNIGIFERILNSRVCLCSTRQFSLPSCIFRTQYSTKEDGDIQW